MEVRRQRKPTLVGVQIFCIKHGIQLGLALFEAKIRVRFVARSSKGKRIP
jgi:uncharacterized membrane protein